MSSEGHVVEAARFARCEFDLPDGADPLPVWNGKNQARFDTDTEVPATDPQPAHERSIAKAPIRQKPNIAQPEEIQQAFDLGKNRQELLGTDLSAGMLKEMGNEQYRSSPVEDGHAD